MILKVGKSYYTKDNKIIHIVDGNSSSVVSSTGLFYLRTGHLMSLNRDLDLVTEI